MPKPKTSLKAVILVGGPGTRLQPLTHYTPKSMVPVLNKPFLEHTIAYLKKYGIEDTILTLSYLPDAIENYFGAGSEFGVQLTYCVENEPLGTAGAVKNAEQHLNNTFVVLNGDVFTDLNIADMLAFHRHKGARATIALKWVDNPGAFGVVETDNDKRIQRFIEKPGPDCITSNWINAGIYILEPEVLKLVPANSHYMFEKGLFPRLLEQGEPVYGYPFDGYWIDMGTPEKYHCLNCDLLLSRTSSPLVQDLSRNGICCDKDVVIHPSARIDGPIIIGSNTVISQRAYIKGPAVIGSDCHVGEDASIEQATLWSGILIGAKTTLRQCIISSDTSIEHHNQITNCVVTPDYPRIPLID